MLITDTDQLNFEREGVKFKNTVKGDLFKLYIFKSMVCKINSDDDNDEAIFDMPLEQF